jgi:hypothetical protein
MENYVLALNGEPLEVLFLEKLTMSEEQLIEFALSEVDGESQPLEARLLIRGRANRRQQQQRREVASTSHATSRPTPPAVAEPLRSNKPTGTKPKVSSVIVRPAPPKEAAVNKPKGNNTTSKRARTPPRKNTGAVPKNKPPAKPVKVADVKPAGYREEPPAKRRSLEYWEPDRCNQEEIQQLFAENERNHPVYRWENQCVKHRPALLQETRYNQVRLYPCDFPSEVWDNFFDRSLGWEEDPELGVCRPEAITFVLSRTVQGPEGLDLVARDPEEAHQMKIIIENYGDKRATDNAADYQPADLPVPQSDQDREIDQLIARLQEEARLEREAANQPPAGVIEEAANESFLLIDEEVIFDEPEEPAEVDRRLSPEGQPAEAVPESPVVKTLVEFIEALGGKDLEQFENPEEAERELARHIKGIQDCQMPSDTEPPRPSKES